VHLLVSKQHINAHVSKFTILHIIDSSMFRSSSEHPQGVYIKQTYIKHG